MQGILHESGVVRVALESAALHRNAQVRHDAFEGAEVPKEGAMQSRQELSVRESCLKIKMQKKS